MATNAGRFMEFYLGTTRSQLIDSEAIVSILGLAKYTATVHVAWHDPCGKEFDAKRHHDITVNIVMNSRIPIDSQRHHDIDMKSHPVFTSSFRAFGRIHWIRNTLPHPTIHLLHVYKP